MGTFCCRTVILLAVILPPARPGVEAAAAAAPAAAGEAGRAVASAEAAAAPSAAENDTAAGAAEVRTARSLSELSRACRSLRALQIVSAVREEGQAEVSVGEVKDVYRQLQGTPGRRAWSSQRLTFRFLCAGETKVEGTGMANNSFLRNTESPEDQKKSLYFWETVHKDCSKVCKFTLSAGITAFDANILFEDSPSTSYEKNAVSYKTGTNPWRCIGEGYQTITTSNVKTVKVRFLLKKGSTFTRLWISLFGTGAQTSCEDWREGADTSCTDTTTPRLSDTAIPSPQRTPRKSANNPPDNFIDLIKVVVPVAGGIIITVIIAVAIYLAKRRQQGSSRTLTDAVPAESTHSQHVPDHEVTVRQDPQHDYQSLQASPPPRPKAHDALSDRRRPAYCHHSDDYEEWDFLKNSRG